MNLAMNKAIKNVAFAAALVFGFNGSAQAAPVDLTFSNTITGDSVVYSFEVESRASNFGPTTYSDYFLSATFNIAGSSVTHFSADALLERDNNTELSVFAVYINPGYAESFNNTMAFDGLIELDGLTGNFTTAYAGLNYVTADYEMTAAAGSYLLTGDTTEYGALSMNRLTFGNPVAVVPVPAAAWLFVSGFIGLVGVARRRQA